MSMNWNFQVLEYSISSVKDKEMVEAAPAGGDGDGGGGSGAVWSLSSSGHGAVWHIPDTVKVIESSSMLSIVIARPEYGSSHAELKEICFQSSV
jgi:hypothetical protein